MLSALLLTGPFLLILSLLCFWFISSSHQVNLSSSASDESPPCARPLPSVGDAEFSEEPRTAQENMVTDLKHGGIQPVDPFSLTYVCTSFSVMERVHSGLRFLVSLESLDVATTLVPCFPGAALGSPRTVTVRVGWVGHVP